MSHGNIKIRFITSDLIKSLELDKKAKLKGYEKEQMAYESYAKKVSPKISAEIRKIADLVDDLDFSRLSTSYSGSIVPVINLKLKERPSKPDFRRIDTMISSLRLSSDEFIVMRQSEYESLLL